MFNIVQNSSIPIARKKANQQIHSSGKEHSFVRKVKQIILANFDNEQFDVATLAHQVHLSVSQLNRRLNALTGLPAGQLIWNMKMDYAAHLLIQGEYSIGRIGAEVGFWNQAHFCRSFKKRFQCTPSQFREAHSL